MSIEQFGESLLGDIRKRNDDRARRNRKQEERNAWITLAGNVAISGMNSYLKENTRNFLTNTDVYTARAQQQMASKHQANLFKTQQAIENAGVSEEAYFESLIKPELQAQFGLQVEGYKPGEVTKYDQLIAEQSRKLAEERAEQYRKALGMASKVESQEEYDTRLVSEAKRANPDTIGSWVGSKVSNFFQGKSQEEIEDEAFLAIAEGPLADNNKALNIFMKKYNETKDASRAFEFTKTIMPEVDPDDTKTKEERIEIKSVGGSIYKVKIEKKRDEFTGDVTEETVGDMEIINPTKDSEAVKLALLDKLKADFNFAKDARTQMTVDAFAEFAEQVDQLSIDLRSIQTLEEYMQVSQIYGMLINSNPDALQDKFRNDIYKSNMDLLMTGSVEIQALLAAWEEDPDKSKEMLEELMTKINKLAMYGRNLAGKTDYSDS